jgi:hypothetical protein
VLGDVLVGLNSPGICGVPVVEETAVALAGFTKDGTRGFFSIYSGDQPDPDSREPAAALVAVCAPPGRVRRSPLCPIHYDLLPGCGESAWNRWKGATGRWNAEGVLGVGVLDVGKTRRLLPSGNQRSMARRVLFFGACYDIDSMRSITCFPFYRDLLARRRFGRSRRPGVFDIPNPSCARTSPMSRTSSGSGLPLPLLRPAAFTVLGWSRPRCMPQNLSRQRAAESPSLKSAQKPQLRTRCAHHRELA